MTTCTCKYNYVGHTTNCSDDTNRPTRVILVYLWYSWLLRRFVAIYIPRHIQPACDNCTKDKIFNIKKSISSIFCTLCVGNVNQIRLRSCGYPYYPSINNQWKNAVKNSMKRHRLSDDYLRFSHFKFGCLSMKALFLKDKIISSLMCNCFGQH